MLKLKQKNVIVLLLLTFTVIAVAAKYYPVCFRWRMDVLDLKWSGKLPNLTWHEVLAGLMPPENDLRKIVEGRVTLQRVEPHGYCPVLWDTPIGALWARYEDHVELELLMWEQLKLKVYDRASAKVRQGDVVLDVGAHIGTFTRFALNRGATTVVAIEPNPDNIICFKQNFDKEIRELRVILIEAAAWETPGTLEFDILPEFPAAAHVTEDGNLLVPAVTIDETIQNLGLNKVDFIKMDIEGSERNALTGAQETISHFRPRMALSTYHREDDPQVITQLVLKAYPGYKVVQKEFSKHLSMAYFF